MLELLEAPGYATFPALYPFLEAFGGLSFEFDRNGASWLISFNIAWSLRQTGPDDRDIALDDSPRLIGCRHTTLVGRAGNEGMLLMNENGVIYYAYGGYVLDEGTGAAAVDSLIARAGDDKPNLPTPIPLAPRKDGGHPPSTILMSLRILDRRTRPVAGTDRTRDVS